MMVCVDKSKEIEQLRNRNAWLEQERERPPRRGREMTADMQTCDVCENASGGKFLGVACVPGAPISIAWCDECIKRDAIPAWIAEHDFIFVAGGKVERLTDWARARNVWADGRYVPFDEFVKRITPEQIETQIKEYEEALGADPAEDAEV